MQSRHTFVEKMGAKIILLKPNWLDGKEKIRENKNRANDTKPWLGQKNIKINSVKFSGYIVCLPIMNTPTYWRFKFDPNRNLIQMVCRKDSE